MKFEEKNLSSVETKCDFNNDFGRIFRIGFYFHQIRANQESVTATIRANPKNKLFSISFDAKRALNILLILIDKL